MTLVTTIKRLVLDSRVWRMLDQPAIFHAARYALVGDQRRTKQLIREHLAASPEESVLDVCCGVGEFAEAVDGRYRGIDLNERFVEQGRRRYAGDAMKSFEAGDVMRLPYPARHFDKAIMVNSLHHFSDEDAVRLLSEIRRITRTLVIVVDADGTPRGILRRLLLALDRGRYMRTPDRLLAVVGGVLPIDLQLAFDVGLYREVLLRCPVGRDEAPGATAGGCSGGA